MAVVSITNGSLSVDIEEVQEYRPNKATGFDMLPDINGEIIAYQKTTPGRTEVPVNGRVKSKVDADNLLSMLDDTLSMTERDGTISDDWQVLTDPPPVVRRKDGDSPDWEVQLRLWRIP
jgi:hypothetical protein